MIKGNKGEWSEFYAFLKILTDRKLFAADAELKKIPEKFYDVLKIIREEAKTGVKIYDISMKAETVAVTDLEGNGLAEISLKRVRAKIDPIFNVIKVSGDTTFEVPLGDEIIKELLCTQIKAVSNQKADIFLIISDRISPTFPKLGFSIKSMLGSPSTLLNASQATNFIYEITGSDFDLDDVNSIDTKSKLRDRMNKLNEVQAALNFKSMENSIFRQNSRKLETNLPEMLAEILRMYYEGKGPNIQMLINELEKEGLIRTKFDLSKNDFEFKVKQFLSAAALGMTPTTIWDGNTIAHGGYIVVKEDGEIVCYHLYNRDEFLTYLLNNTKLETPSTSRHKFGDVYEIDGRKFIKLNLQIRFIR